MPKSTPKADSTRDADRAKLEAEVATLRAGWQRTQADFENFRRRIDDERQTLTGRIAAETLMEFVPAYDNFQRAFVHLSDEHQSWADGFRHIAKQIEAVFASHGLVRIPTVGEQFDPRNHEAVSELPHQDHPADTVAEELESGWSWNGSVIKPAKVIVSTGPMDKKS